MKIENRYVKIVSNFSNLELLNSLEKPDYFDKEVYNAVLNVSLYRKLISQEQFDSLIEVRVDVEIENLTNEDENEVSQINNETFWKCPKCGEKIEKNFDVCWNCQDNTKGEIEDPTVNKIIINQSEEEVLPVNPADYWKCSKCGQSIEMNFDTCWNCQANKPWDIEHPSANEIINDQLAEDNEILPVNSEDYWKCPNCGQTIELNFDACWNCQNDIPGVIEHPTINEIVKYQSNSKPFSFLKSGFGLIGTGFLLVMISGVTPLPDIFEFSYPSYVRFIFGIFFILAGFVILVIGLTQKIDNKKE